MIGTPVVAALLRQIVVVAALPGNNQAQPHFSLASNGMNANASLVENALTDNAFNYGTAVVPLHDQSQWRIQDIFKRQANCVNYCGPTQSAPSVYCGCGKACCAGGCCTTASGELCCGSSCCINGATCASNTCMARTVTLSITATSTVPVYRDQTAYVTAVAGTQTIIQTVTSVAVVTVSSADVATFYVTITSTKAAAKKARDLDDSRPADSPAPPFATSTIPSDAYITRPHVAQDVLKPQITPMPGSTDHNEALHLDRRQALALTTVTRTVAIVTITTTVPRTFTSTVSARATVTSSFVVYQTVTSVVNAKRTTTATTTQIITPNAPTTVEVTVNGVPTTIAAGVTTVIGGITTVGGSTSPSQGSGSGTADNSNQNGDSAPQNGSRGLSKGAQIGIGAGTGAGSLVICLILGFWCRKRRKSRKEQNQEMIQDAVSSAMAAQQTQQQPQRPISYYDKHMSTTTYSTASPHPNSPSPQLHAPQPGYVYPPPPGHQRPVYSTDPMNFPEAMGSQPRFSNAAPLYGTEIAGSPVQRYELPLYNSPPPQHPGPYSDLPEVRR